MLQTGTGYYTIAMPPAGGTAPMSEHLWYLKDHLGNNRVLTNERGIALSTRHYDPYGAEISISISNPSNPFLPGMADSPYKYGGKERNATTSTYDFEARYLSPSFHRFTTMDPLCEKYYSIIPYAYCARNPVNRGSDGGCRCRWWSGGWTTISKNRSKMPMVVHGVDHCQHLREAYDGDKPLVLEIRVQRPYYDLQ